jgi:hypothetical protein
VVLVPRGVLLATVAFAALGGYLIYGFAALLIIAAGLLTLAWLERGVLLAVTGLVFSGFSVLANVLKVTSAGDPRPGWVSRKPEGKRLPARSARCASSSPVTNPDRASM